MIVKPITFEEALGIWIHDFEHYSELCMVAHNEREQMFYFRTIKYPHTTSVLLEKLGVDSIEKIGVERVRVPFSVNTAQNSMKFVISNNLPVIGKKVKIDFRRPLMVGAKEAYKNLQMKVDAGYKQLVRMPYPAPFGEYHGWEIYLDNHMRESQILQLESWVDSLEEAYPDLEDTFKR